LQVIAEHTLLCVPPSGAGRSYFRTWPRTLGESTVAPISLPGRDERFREPLVRTMGDAVRELLPTVERLARARCSLYGHSLGAAIAFELARAVEACRGKGAVASLVVSGRAAPHLDAPVELELPRRPRDLARTVGRLRGSVDAARFHPEVVSLTIPIFRADLTLSAGYRWDGELPLSTPVVAVAFADDEVVPPALVERWAEATTGAFAFHVLDGDHGTPAQAPPALLDVVAATPVAG
jgi:pyochelin biosynthesis protein PchC